ncbi:maestro heat-like repeat-containing protein family member 6 [Sylvia atricapilla]|uniref:maestro heat-like repeat-containing protein family member 6 n=1 Tax=Sylvia atricapilla TaxID=48155 RepID=UPI00339A0CA2
MAGRFLGLFKLFRRKRKKGPGAVGPLQHEELEQFQQDDAAMDWTQDHKPAWSHTEGTAEPDCRLIELQAEPDIRTDLDEESEDYDAEENDKENHDMAVTEDGFITNTDMEETQGTTNTDTTPTPTLSQELILDYFKDPCVSSEQQVPAMVKDIHQSLESHVTVDARMQIDIVRLAEEHPADVVLTLLRCAPTCDRAAAMMWRTIGSLGPAVEKVLPALISVMQDWPLHSMCTSDGDNKDVFALAATLVVWVIVQEPECHEAIILYSAQLFVSLLFHIVITTEQMPEEVDHFWRACREEHRLPCNPNRSQSSCPSHILGASASAPIVTWLCSAHRFAVQTLKSLLCRLRCDNEVIAMERKRGWDTLLCAHTQHYAVGLLAREMRHVLIPFCSRIAFHLLKPLSREETGWDLPFLAFLVEVLQYLDLTKCGDSVLEIMSRYLENECRERQRLALRGLLVLSEDPSMAIRMCSLSRCLVDLLGDADGDVIGMALCVFINLLKNKDILISSTTALKLAEALQLLFDHDNSHVQVLSLDLFFKLMDLVVDEGKMPLEKILSQSLLPLYLHCHDENQHVANAAWETLLRVTKFLKRRKLKQLVRKKQLLKFSKCLLADDRSRAAEHLRRALPYLESPQESLREAALRFIGEPRARAPSPARRSSAPAPTPAAAPAAAAAGPGAVEPRLASGPPPPSGSRALGRQRAARARAEPCRGRRPCGHRAGSAAGREPCRCGPDRFFVLRGGRSAHDGAEGRAPAPQ